MPTAPQLPRDRCPKGWHHNETTPYYIFHPYVPERVHALVPDVRLIIVLRDPVERTLSQYFHSRRAGLENLDLRGALVAEEMRLLNAHGILGVPDQAHLSHQEHSYLSRSRYELQVQVWQQRFPSQQIVILRSEDLFDHPEKVWHKLLNFLGLTPMRFPAAAFHSTNTGLGEASSVPAEQRSWIRDQLESTYAYLASLENSTENPLK
jgi:hypothetical protein